jgi:peptidoglycan LD-endopeptidase CwlK
LSTRNEDTASKTPPGIQCLRRGYPEAVTGVEREGTTWYVVINRSTRLVWDDGVERSFEEKLQSPDLEDQLSIPYGVGPVSSPLKENDDPGRIRVASFFKAVYGADSAQVRSRLRPVVWLPGRGDGRVRFNHMNGAAKSLSKVSRELTESLSDNALRYVRRPGGTFNWRRIAGTDRLSAHAFGIAIDINVKFSNYWRWEMKDGLFRYKNRIPHEIVDIFEKHGFIWGGKWYHFDTMHFEYRPELLVHSCRR